MPLPAPAVTSAVVQCSEWSFQASQLMTSLLSRGASA